MRTFLAVFGFFLFPPYAPGVHAGHTHVEFTFDNFVEPGFPSVWTGWNLETHGSTVYLGDFLGGEGVTLTQYDVLAFPTFERQVNLTFDFIALGGPSTGTLEIVQVQGGNPNGTVYSTTVGTASSSESHNASFSLIYDFVDATDLEINFAVTGLAGATWGLDNVVLDWAQAVPEPATGALFGAAIIGLALYARRR